MEYLILNYTPTYKEQEKKKIYTSSNNMNQIL